MVQRLVMLWNQTPRWSEFSIYCIIPLDECRRPNKPAHADALWAKVSKMMDGITTASPLPIAGVADAPVSTPCVIEQKPRVIPDIEIAHLTTRTGTPYVVIRNPAANTYLKLQSRESDLLRLMDGTRTLPALVIEDFKQHKVLAPPRVAGLIRLLQDNHFLADPPVRALNVSSHRAPHGGPTEWLRRFARGMMYTEFPIRNADQWADKSYRRWGRWFFSPPALVLLAVLVLLGPALFVWEMINRQYSTAQPAGASLWGVGVLLALGVLVLTIHEFGHALMVKRAGRTVIRAGFLLYYGFPAAFVDTTDIWMTPLRTRLLTSLAGPMTGFLVGGLCAMAAFLLPPGPVGAFLFAWGFVCFFNNFLNFNPLLELDGYYILVDLLDKPMLRARAFAFVRGPLWAKLGRRERLTKEERLFALFGVASAIFTVFFLFLGLEFWREQLQRPLADVWENGGIAGRAVLGVLAAVIAIPVLVGLANWVRELSGSLSERLAWRRARIRSRPHRAVVDLLRKSALWSDLPEDELSRLAQAFRPRPVIAGQEVVRQGQPSDAYYIVARGEFQVRVDGKPVKRLTRGDDFGKRALLDNAPRAASILALERGLAFSIDRDAFRAALADDLERSVQLEAALSYRAEIGGMAVLRDLSTAELRPLFDKLVPVSVPADTVINTPDVVDDRFYIVRSGRVQVVRDGAVLATLGPGEAFNEEGLLQNVPTTATMRTLEPTELLALSMADFNDLMGVYSSRAG